MKKQRTLLVGAHPDDIETLLSGTVENNTFACVATDGEASTVNHTNSTNYVIKGRRRTESQRGLERTGIAVDHQYYLNLPDGDLADTQQFAQLTTQLYHLLLSEHITRVVTLGPEGFDEHPDHIATHLAVIKAIERIQLEHPDAAFQIFALNAHGNGSHAVPVDTRRKLHAMCAHKSQFLVSEAAVSPFEHCITICGCSIDSAFWDYFAPYHELILKQETYDISHYPARA